MPFYVERTRLRERRGHLLGAPSRIGEIKYSDQTYATRTAAEQELTQWSAADWSCRVVEGRSPSDRNRW